MAVRERNSHGHAVLLIYAGCMRGCKREIDINQYATEQDCLREQIDASSSTPTMRA